jgi:hypothetical protein
MKSEGRPRALFPEPTKGVTTMAQLIEPDGTENIIATVAYAIQFCREHPGWSWRYVDAE